MMFHSKCVETFTTFDKHINVLWQIVLFTPTLAQVKATDCYNRTTQQVDSTRQNGAVDMLADIEMFAYYDDKQGREGEEV